MTLATTIAVMSEGTLQQVGTPNDIYDRPANRFVAEFVGSPPINILETQGGHPLDRSAANWLERRLGGASGVGCVGLRPEALQIAHTEASVPGDSFRNTAQVTGILPTGGSWIIELNVDGRALFSTTTECPVLNGGEQVYVHVRPTAMHVFDRNGDRLSAADDILARAA
jgi:iron(III) transport system ATP-binding protein